LKPACVTPVRAAPASGCRWLRAPWPAAPPAGGQALLLRPAAARKYSTGPQDVTRQRPASR
jgi:hypothetical protein